MSGIVKNLYCYPIKGLSAQPLEKVRLKAGEGFPLDRAFGFARPGSGFDPQNPKPLPKTKFVMLARDAALASLATRYDEETNNLTITDAQATFDFDIGNPEGREKAAAHLSNHLGFTEDMQPTLHSAEPHKFTDVSVVSPAMMNAVSLINLDSVEHLSSTLGQPVSAARFRANILFSGADPFSELEWVGQIITIGDVRLKVVKRTKRCPATEVNPDTATRDLDIPKLLRDHYGHSDMGVYAEVLTDGELSPGDTMQLP